MMRRSCSSFAPLKWRKPLKSSIRGIKASIGSGVFKDFPEWIKNRSDTLLVGGGLSKDNVCDVIRDIQPFGVDVSSGVEKDGVKDLAMMKEFIGVVHSCSC